MRDEVEGRERRVALHVERPGVGEAAPGVGVDAKQDAPGAVLFRQPPALGDELQDRVVIRHCQFGSVARVNTPPNRLEVVIERVSVRPARESVSKTTRAQAGSATPGATPPSRAL